MLDFLPKNRLVLAYRPFINQKIITFFQKKTFCLQSVPPDVWKAAMTTMFKLLQIMRIFFDESPKLIKTKEYFQKAFFLKLLFWTYIMSFYGTFREFFDKTSNSF